MDNSLEGSASTGGYPSDHIIAGSPVAVSKKIPPGGILGGKKVPMMMKGKMMMPPGGKMMAMPPAKFAVKAGGKFPITLKPKGSMFKPKSIAVAPKTQISGFGALSGSSTGNETGPILNSSFARPVEPSRPPAPPGPHHIDYASQSSHVAEPEAEAPRPEPEVDEVIAESPSHTLIGISTTAASIIPVAKSTIDSAASITDHSQKTVAVFEQLKSRRLSVEEPLERQDGSGVSASAEGNKIAEEGRSVTGFFPAPSAVDQTKPISSFEEPMEVVERQAPTPGATESQGEPPLDPQRFGEAIMAERFGQEVPPTPDELDSEKTEEKDETSGRPVGETKEHKAPLETSSAGDEDVLVEDVTEDNENSQGPEVSFQNLSVDLAANGVGDSKTQVNENEQEQKEGQIVQKPVSQEYMVDEFQGSHFPESSPDVAGEQPVRAASGFQKDNLFTATTNAINVKDSTSSGDKRAIEIFAESVIMNQTKDPTNEESDGDNAASHPGGPSMDRSSGRVEKALDWERRDEQQSAENAELQSQKVDEDGDGKAIVISPFAEEGAGVENGGLPDSMECAAGITVSDLRGSFPPCEVNEIRKEFARSGVDEKAATEGEGEAPILTETEGATEQGMQGGAEQHGMCSGMLIKDTTANDHDQHVESSQCSSQVTNDDANSRREPHSEGDNYRVPLSGTARTASEQLIESGTEQGEDGKVGIIVEEHMDAVSDEVYYEKGGLQPKRLSQQFRDLASDEEDDDVRIEATQAAATLTVGISDDDRLELVLSQDTAPSSSVPSMQVPPNTERSSLVGSASQAQSPVVMLQNYLEEPDSPVHPSASYQQMGSTSLRHSVLISRDAPEIPTIESAVVDADQQDLRHEGDGHFAKGKSGDSSGCVSERRNSTSDTVLASPSSFVAAGGLTTPEIGSHTASGTRVTASESVELPVWMAPGTEPLFQTGMPHAVTPPDSEPLSPIGGPLIHDYRGASFAEIIEISQSETLESSAASTGHHLHYDRHCQPVPVETENASYPNFKGGSCLAHASVDGADPAGSGEIMIIDTEEAATEEDDTEEPPDRSSRLRTVNSGKERQMGDEASFQHSAEEQPVSADDAEEPHWVTNEVIATETMHKFQYQDSERYYDEDQDPEQQEGNAMREARGHAGGAMYAHSEATHVHQQRQQYDFYSAHPSGPFFHLPAGGEQQPVGTEILDALDIEKDAPSPYGNVQRQPRHMPTGDFERHRNSSHSSSPRQDESETVDAGDREDESFARSSSPPKSPKTDDDQDESTGTPRATREAELSGPSVSTENFIAVVVGLEESLAMTSPRIQEANQERGPPAKFTLSGHSRDSTEAPVVTVSASASRRPGVTHPLAEEVTRHAVSGEQARMAIVPVSLHVEPTTAHQQDQPQATKQPIAYISLEQREAYYQQPSIPVTTSTTETTSQIHGVAEEAARMLLQQRQHEAAAARLATAEKAGISEDTPSNATVAGTVTHPAHQQILAEQAAAAAAAAAAQSVYPTAGALPGSEESEDEYNEPAVVTAGPIEIGKAMAGPWVPAVASAADGLISRGSSIEIARVQGLLERTLHPALPDTIVRTAPLMQALGEVEVVMARDGTSTPTTIDTMVSPSQQGGGFSVLSSPSGPAVTTTSSVALTKYASAHEPYPRKVITAMAAAHENTGCPPTTALTTDRDTTAVFGQHEQAVTTEIPGSTATTLYAVATGGPITASTELMSARGNNPQWPVQELPVGIDTASLTYQPKQSSSGDPSSSWVIGLPDSPSLAVGKASDRPTATAIATAITTSAAPTQPTLFAPLRSSVATHYVAATGSSMTHVASQNQTQPTVVTSAVVPGQQPACPAVISTAVGTGVLFPRIGHEYSASNQTSTATTTTTGTTVSSCSIAPALYAASPQLVGSLTATPIKDHFVSSNGAVTGDPHHIPLACFQRPSPLQPHPIPAVARGQQTSFTAHANRFGFGPFISSRPASSTSFAQQQPAPFGSMLVPGINQRPAFPPQIQSSIPGLDVLSARDRFTMGRTSRSTQGQTAITPTASTTTMMQVPPIKPPMPMIASARPHYVPPETAIAADPSAALTARTTATPNFDIFRVVRHKSETPTAASRSGGPVRAVLHSAASGNQGIPAGPSRLLQAPVGHVVTDSTASQATSTKFVLVPTADSGPTLPSRVSPRLNNRPVSSVSYPALPYPDGLGAPITTHKRDHPSVNGMAFYSPLLTRKQSTKTQPAELAYGPAITTATSHVTDIPVQAASVVQPVSTTAITTSAGHATHISVQDASVTKPLTSSAITTSAGNVAQVPAPGALVVQPVAGNMAGIRSSHARDRHHRKVGGERGHSKRRSRTLGVYDYELQESPATTWRERCCCGCGFERENGIARHNKLTTAATSNSRSSAGRSLAQSRHATADRIQTMKITQPLNSTNSMIGTSSHQPAGYSTHRQHPQDGVR